MRQCKNCSNALLENEVFCGQCGTKYECEESETQDAISPNMADYVSVNVKYYITRFNKMKESHSKTSWNWFAFVEPVCWFVYRKMYGYAAGIFCIEVIWMTLFPVTNPIHYLTNIFYAIFANYLYMRRIEDLVGKQNNLNEEVAIEQLKRKGGVNIWVAIVVMIFLTWFTW